MKKQADIEATLERIKAHKGVTGVIIANSDGVPIRPTKGMDDDTTHAYTAELAQLAAKARSVVRDLDPTVRQAHYHSSTPSFFFFLLRFCWWDLIRTFRRMI